MTFGQDALEQLSRELLGGYNLNTRLLALLASEPLDSRRQEAAVAMIQELSGVLMSSLMASLFLLSSGGSDGAARTSSPEATITEGSVDQRAPAEDKRSSSGEELTPHRKVRGEVVKEDITASPVDAYQWRKYGQKIIQYSEFPRVYYRCMYSHGRGCGAKKQVQQRDNSSRRPMYQVTYVNEHTCHQVLPGPSEPTRAPPTSTPTHRNNSTPWSGHFDHPRHHVVDGNGAESENKIMTAAFATVTGGAPSPLSLPGPPLLESSQPIDLPSTYKPDDAHLPFPFGSPLPSVQTPAAPWSSMSPPLPEQVWPTDSESCMLADGGYNTPDPMSIEEILQLFSPDAAQSISQCCGDDMPVAVTPFPDSMSAWPQYC
ncbi:hypothetical protein ACQ4PT_020081 [Festuca glaucescens]